MVGLRKVLAIHGRCAILYVVEGKMKIVDYSYQKNASDQVLRNALDSKYLASILAACPSAGKSTISHMVINKYITLRPNARVLVLTEGQNNLKNQYLDELTEPNTEINFSFGDFKSDAQVRVGIPQSINDLDWSQIELLIVDEAHRFFLEPMVQDIIKKLNPLHTILMTGSPTKYNLHNQTQRTQYGIHYISADQLIDRGVFSAVDMDVVRVLDTKDPHRTIMKVLVDAEQKKDDLTKMMIACPNIAYAKKVADHLKYTGRKVSLSTSKNDPNDEKIKEFKSGETDVLIVVGRGILGFNDKNVTFLADLRSSDNLDASYQLFARVLRRHPKGTKKSYIRVADKDYNKQVLTLHKIKALMEEKIFKGYNGKNLKMEVANGFI